MFVYLANYLVVQISIIMFIGVFFFWYWLSHKESLKTLGFNHYLENFFCSRQANWMVFAWAASEALIWFVIPEFLLLLVIFMRVHNKKQMLMYDIAGTVFGTIVALVIRLPEKYIEYLPYIQPKMVSQTKIWFNENGVFGLLYQPFSGVPYKVFTHLAWQYKYNLLIFLFVAVAARIVRYVFAYGLFLLFYPRLHRVIYRNYVPLFIVAVIIFSILLMKTYMTYAG